MMHSRIDFHTHILPAIDDGSCSVDESIEMILMEKSQGVDVICLTPHFLAQEQYPEQFLQKRDQSLAILQERLKQESIEVQLVSGAEVMYYPGMSRWEQLPQLTLGSSQYVLIEFPGNRLTDSMLLEVESIYTERELIPILAHVERYLQPIHAKELLRRLDELPCLLQINASYIIDRHTKKTALNFLKQGRVQLIGSDCHSSTWRKPTMDQVFDILNESLDSSVLDQLSMIGQAILNGRNIL